MENNMDLVEKNAMLPPGINHDFPITNPIQQYKNSQL